MTTFSEDELTLLKDGGNEARTNSQLETSVVHREVAFIWSAHHKRFHQHIIYKYICWCASGVGIVCTCVQHRLPLCVLLARLLIIVRDIQYQNAP